MGGFAARKCRVLLDNMTYILGVELLNCLSAVDLEHKAPSVKLKRIRDEVRKQIPLL